MQRRLQKSRLPDLSYFDLLSEDIKEELSNIQFSCNATFETKKLDKNIVELIILFNSASEIKSLELHFYKSEMTPSDEIYIDTLKTFVEKVILNQKSVTQFERYSTLHYSPYSDHIDVGSSGLDVKIKLCQEFLMALLKVENSFN